MTQLLVWFSYSFSLIYKSKVDDLTPLGKKPDCGAQNVNRKREEPLDKEDLDSGE
jgi:hypothetical protein